MPRQRASPPGAPRVHPGRRRFLKQTTSGLIFLTLARYIPAAAIARESMDEPPVEPGEKAPLRYFSAHEYRVVRAASARLVGPSDPETARVEAIDAALRADLFLAGEEPEIQSQIHLLLTVFSSTLFAFLFDLRMRQFLDMSVEEQDAWLGDWMTSRLAFRRKGFIALKRLCLSMYYTDTRSWSQLRYDGSIPGGGVQ
jgi:hypothetical protein